MTSKEMEEFDIKKKKMKKVINVIITVPIIQ